MAADDDLDCRHASKLLSVSWERPLSDAERLALKQHLEACFMCRNFEGQLEVLRQAAERFRIG